MKEFFTSRFQTISDYFSSQTFSFKYFGNSFSWKFWTESGIGASSSYTAMVLLVVFIVIIGLIFWRRALKKRQLQTPVYDWPLNQLINLIIFIVIIALSYWFFRSQELSYLSSRLVVLLSIIVSVVWVSWIIIYIKRVTSAKRDAYLEKERFFRYLPKSKKVRN